MMSGISRRLEAEATILFMLKYDRRMGTRKRRLFDELLELIGEDIGDLQRMCNQLCVLRNQL